MLGDLFYRLGTWAGTGIAVVGDRLAAMDPPDPPDPPDPSNPSDTAGGRPGSADGEAGGALVDAAFTVAAAWVIKTVLRPRSVSWPRVVVAGIGATVLSDAVGRALGPAAGERDRAYDDDPDALLVRVASGVAMAAGYAAVLYPRLPGSPLAKGLIFGAMELAAAPHGGLVRVATDTPGLRFPLKDLAVPLTEDPGPLAGLAFGVAVGLLYRPDLDDH